MASRPSVDELLEMLQASKTKSTVEIREVPIKYNSPTRKSGNYDNRYIHVENNNSTFSRSQRHQMFYENNETHFNPVITTTTDDENEDRSDSDNGLPSEMEVESMLNESAKVDPPRTSTPNSTRSQFIRSRLTFENNRSTEKSELLGVKIVGPLDCSKQINEDPLNASQDTDELNNTGTPNQSGGCELIGINDNSDQVINSKFSPQSIEEKVPYTVQIFTETEHESSELSPNSDNIQQLEANLAVCIAGISRVKELENVTNSLLECFDRLKTQVDCISAKVDTLETKLERQQVEIKFIETKREANSYKANDSSYAQDEQSSHNQTQQSPSQNRFALRTNPDAVINRYSSCTYSRNPTLSTCKPSMKDSMSNSVTNGSNQAVSHMISSRPLKKTASHASTNSLYADSFKSYATSNSPSSNFNVNRTISPNSLMNLNKREHISHSSMLSLTSIGPFNGSGLKKTSAITGSVSNLSQIGTQLTEWPSESDFVQGKHRSKEIAYSDKERLIHMILYNRMITMRVPRLAGSDYDLDKLVEPPNIYLKMDWVYGYRGRDCRSNVFYLPTGECVYFVGSIIVLYNPDAQTQRHYLGHTESVKCLAVHPNRLIIASGQSSVQNRRDKKPTVRVWNTVSLATLRVITFNEDFDRSICCIAFSKHDQGSTLAVVDESNEHTITLLDWQREKNWRISEANSGHEPVLAIDFHPIDKTSLVAVGKSTINFWDVRGLTLTKKSGLFDKYDKPKYVLCLAFNDLGDTITGDSNGNVVIWPRGSNRPRRVVRDAHQGGVFSIIAMKDGSYLTGGRDRRILEWDEEFTKTGRSVELPEHCGGVRFITYARGPKVLIGTLKNSILLGSIESNFTLIMQGHAEAISSLAVHPTGRRYLTGGFDEQVHLFDAETHQVVWSKCLMMPVTAATFSQNGSLLVAGSTLGKWLVLDAITQEILFTKCDGSGTISCVKFSPNGEYFAMGSSDAQVYVYQTTEAGNKFCRVGTCVGHSAPIKDLDWSDDGSILQTQSMNFEILFWRASNCRPVDDFETIEHLNWFTHNCTIGFNSIGIWSDSIDFSMINSCDRSNDQELMASVTDTGTINVFKWPTCFNKCLPQKFYSNVDKLNFVRFLSDDSKLITIGAKSCVTVEWIIDKGESFKPTPYVS